MKSGTPSTRNITGTEVVEAIVYFYFQRIKDDEKEIFFWT